MDSLVSALVNAMAPSGERSEQDAPGTQTPVLAVLDALQQSAAPPPTYGYHNTFHSRSQPQGLPPAYGSSYPSARLDRIASQASPDVSSSSSTAGARRRRPAEPLPAYSCSISIEGPMGFKHELDSPFRRSDVRRWSDVYVVLEGTQLRLHRLKTRKILSKAPGPYPGRLIASYTLQHAEVGIAVDFQRTALVPRSTLARLVPASNRQKLYETDPHLFEPVREFALRLRIETEQILLCASTEEDMLTWVESLCAAIDLAPPIEDRTEPRYRSLPRRSRRQRLLDVAYNGSNGAAPEQGATTNAEQDQLQATRRLIEEQERIINRMYPQLAQSSSPTTGTESNGSANASETAAATEGSNTDDNTPNPDPVAMEVMAAVVSSVIEDPEADDLDPADVRDASSRPRRISSGIVSSSLRQGSVSSASYPSPPPSPSFFEGSSRSSISSPTPPEEKPEPSTEVTQASTRFRRRCAPVLLFDSPRASDVLCAREGTRRLRISYRELSLMPFYPSPPKYDAHNFTEQDVRVALNGGEFEVEVVLEEPEAETAAEDNTATETAVVEEATTTSPAPATNLPPAVEQTPEPVTSQKSTDIVLPTGGVRKTHRSRNPDTPLLRRGPSEDSVYSIGSASSATSEANRSNADEDFEAITAAPLTPDSELSPASDDGSAAPPDTPRSDSKSSEKGKSKAKDKAPRDKRSEKEREKREKREQKEERKRAKKEASQQAGRGVVAMEGAGPRGAAAKPTTFSSLTARAVYA